MTMPLWTISFGFTEPCYNKIKLSFLPMAAEFVSDSLYFGKQVSPCSYFQLSYK